MKKLTDNSLKSTPMKERLGILNRVISGDFQDKITMDTLNSRETVSLRLKPEVEAQLKGRMVADDKIQLTADPLAQQHYAPTLDPEQGYANGRDLEAMNDRKGWYREGKHGRDVEVGDIWVEKSPTPDNAQNKDKEHEQRNKEQKFTYRMCAVINGEVISHDISKKQYDKYMAVDDYQRQRMMSKVFHEVDMKTRPEMRQGFNLGAFVGAGLAALSDATYLGADIAHNVEHIKHPQRCHLSRCRHRPQR